MTAKQVKEVELELSKKDAKKVAKLEPKIAFFIGRNDKDEAQKIRDQIAAIWDKAKAEQVLKTCASYFRALSPGPLTHPSSSPFPYRFSPFRQRSPSPVKKMKRNLPNFWIWSHYF